MTYVLDSSAMIALLRDEASAEVVAEALVNQGNACFAHAVNLCEVYYDAVRERGANIAQAVLDDLYSVRVQPRTDMDSSFWQEAGRLKAVHRRRSR